MSIPIVLITEINHCGLDRHNGDNLLENNYIDRVRHGCSGLLIIHIMTIRIEGRWLLTV